MTEQVLISKIQLKSILHKLEESYVIQVKLGEVLGRSFYSGDLGLRGSEEFNQRLEKGITDGKLPILYYNLTKHLTKNEHWCTIPDEYRD